MYSCGGLCVAVEGSMYGCGTGMYSCGGLCSGCGGTDIAVEGLI